MMRRFRPAVLVVVGLLLFLPGAARGQKLDDDDKRFLKDVRPIILPDERALLEKLEDEADRLAFQEIFWARRDPDLATPENEFQEQYLENRKAADRRFSMPRTPGSATECGRLFILFGEPDEIQRVGDPFPPPVRWSNSLNAPVRNRQPLTLVRLPEVWVYEDRPDRRMARAREKITFDAACRAGGGFAAQLDRMAAKKIVHPNIDYEVGEDGHLVKPAAQLAADGPSRGSSRHP